MMFLEIVWNLFLPRMMYLLDNNNFPKLYFIFKPFCMMMFLERSVYFLDWRRFAEYWNGAFATYANACGCG